MRTPPTRVLAALAGALVLALAGFLVLRATAPEHTGTAPVSGDSGETTYAGGSLPEGQEEAVAVAAEVMPLALGYDFRSLQEGLDKATALMTEDFGKEFSDTFAASAGELAEKQQAVTSANVRAAGVVRVEDGRVLCLVYVDQVLVSSTTLENPETPVQVSQNRVLVGVSDASGEWLVDSIQPF